MVKRIRGAEFNDPEVEDWPKVGSWDLPTTIDEFEEAIAPTTLAEFLALPAAEAMPARLRSAIDRRLE